MTPLRLSSCGDSQVAWSVVAFEAWRAKLRGVPGTAWGKKMVCVCGAVCVWTQLGTEGGGGGRGKVGGEGGRGRGKGEGGGGGGREDREGEGGRGEEGGGSNKKCGWELKKTSFLSRY